MYFRLFTLLQKKTNCYLLTHHTWKMLPHYLVKCTNFSSFPFFSRVSSTTNPQYGRVAETACCDMAEFLHSMVDDAVDQWRKNWKHVSVQKVVTLNICCNVACLAFHLPHTTTGSFQSHQCQPTTGFFQSHQRLEECNIPSVRWKCCPFYKVVWRHFSCVDVFGTQCMYLYLLLDLQEKCLSRFRWHWQAWLS